MIAEDGWRAGSICVLGSRRQDEVAPDQNKNLIRNLSEYLNNWQSVEAKLS
jgi:hypothetical protein